MKKVLRITENDIRNMVCSVLYESLTHNETIRGGNGEKLQDLNVIADNWRKAVLDKMNGGKGVSVYNGKEYSINDWIGALMGSESFQKNAMMNKIPSAVGGEIKDIHKKQVKAYLNKYYGMHIKDVSEFNTREDLKDNKLVHDLLQQRNKYRNLDDDEKWDIYANFFLDPDTRSSLTNMADIIATKAGNAPEDVVTMLYTALQTYSRVKYRMMLQSGGRPSLTMGNMSFENPVTNEKDIDYFDGENFINSEAEMNTADMTDIENNTTSEEKQAMLDMVRDLMRLCAKYYPRENRNQGKIAIAYIYKHFDDVFNSDMLAKLDTPITRSAKSGKNLSKSERVLAEQTSLFRKIKEAATEYITEKYNEAIESGNTQDEITKLFPIKNQRPRSAQEVGKMLNDLVWPLFGKYAKIYRQLQNREYNEKRSNINEVVSRIVRQVIREARKRAVSRKPMMENKINHKKGLLF